ncbi:MAG: putative DCC family thiol-disulfide oxidoreductase YuxK, partial [Hyphomonas sp.]
MFSDPGTFIVYDGDCPFCSEYVKLLRLRDAIGPVSLVNAREDHPAV